MRKASVGEIARHRIYRAHRIFVDHTQDLKSTCYCYREVAL